MAKQEVIVQIRVKLLEAFAAKNPTLVFKDWAEDLLTKKLQYYQELIDQESIVTPAITTLKSLTPDNQVIAKTYLENLKASEG
ncbi:MAG: hypothetical protein WC449_05500 [Candidatus Paceibacterota bacterium]